MPVQQPERESTPADRWYRSTGNETLAFGGLVVLSIIGVAIADFSAGDGLWFWLLLTPLYAAFSIATGWTRARGRGETGTQIVWKRAVHWLTLPPAFYLIYWLQASGRLNREDAGLVALVVLALTTVLAGVHFDWRLILLGLLLGATAGAAALAEEFFWVLLLAAVAVAAVAVFWRRRTE